MSLLSFGAYRQVQHGEHGKGGVSRKERFPVEGRKEKQVQLIAQLFFFFFTVDCKLFLPRPPGLLNVTLVAGAHVVGDVSLRAVDGGEIRPAHVQEVRPHPTHRHLGDVGDRLADGTTEEKHAQLRDHTHTHCQLQPVKFLQLITGH